jgi:hypothetical protein
MRRPEARTRVISRGFVRRESGPKLSLDLRDAVLAWELNRQHATTLLASATQHFPTPLGCHSRSEAVRTNSALITRSICRLTHLVRLH